MRFVGKNALLIFNLNIITTIFIKIILTKVQNLSKNVDFACSNTLKKKIKSHCYLLKHCQEQRL